MNRLCIATLASVLVCGSAFAQGRLPSPTLTNPVITGGTISGAAGGFTTLSASGTTTLGSSAFNGVSQQINGVAGGTRWTRWQTAGLTNWQLGPFGVRTGNNAGDDLVFSAFDDAGTNLSRGITLTRASGGLSLTTNNAMTAGNTTQNAASTGSFWRQTFSGVDGGPTPARFLNDWSIADSLDHSVAAPSGPVIGYAFQHVASGYKNGRIAVLSQFVQSGASIGSGDQSYQGGQSNAFARFSEPGATSSAPLGNLYGFSSNGAIQTGFVANNWKIVTGFESDVGISAGSSARSRTGAQIANLGAVQAYGSVDAGLWIYDGGGSNTAPFKQGILFGGTQKSAVDPTIGSFVTAASYGVAGTSAAPLPAQWGMDLMQATFPATGNPYDGGFLRSNGFSVSGSGTTQIGSAYLTPGTTGLAIDAKGSFGSSAAVAAGGSGYTNGFHTITSQYGGLWMINSTGGVFSGAVTQISAPAFPTTTTPANPVTAIDLNNGAGTGLTLNITWNTTATTLALNPSGGATTVGGTLGVSGAATFNAKATFGGVGLAGLGIDAAPILAKFGWLDISANNGGTVGWTTGSAVRGTSLVSASANQSGTLPTSVGQYGAFAFGIPADTVNSGTNSGFNGMTIAHNWGGVGMAGSRTSLLIQSVQTGAVGTANAFYDGANIWMTANFAGNGGNLIALNPQVNLSAGATGWALAEIMEGQVQALQPISGRVGVQMFAGLGYQGSSYDFAYGVSGIPGGVGFLTAFQLGKSDVPWGLDTTNGAIMTAAANNTMQLKHGIYLPNVTVTGSWLNLGGVFKVAGNGVVTPAAFTVATLPAAATAGAGAIAYVTDATAPTYRGALTGGGTVKALVFSDGASWTSQ